MPLSRARLSRRTDLSSSTSPHQPVLTVQTPKPTSDTCMSVSPRLLYLIYKPLDSYLELTQRELPHSTGIRRCYVPNLSSGSFTSVRLRIWVAEDSNRQGCRFGYRAF